MQFIADLHIHSRFSRATSRDMDIPAIAAMAKTKGIKLVATGDFTHPEYFKSLKQNLKPTGTGLFTHDGTYFMLNVELNGIYSAGGKLRRIHNMVFVPSFETAERLSAWLDGYGKLASDGRPTLGLSSRTCWRNCLTSTRARSSCPHTSGPRGSRSTARTRGSTRLRSASAT